ncbi:anticodon-binding domain-containing protein [Lipomyces oligophaga]|uniref:anticodon-binding domain-containing protein n=1 Tax=Lipomyces oligophaga TaxID=45792 RepID=UPI0034CE6A6E
MTDRRNYSPGRNPRFEPNDHVGGHNGAHGGFDWIVGLKVKVLTTLEDEIVGRVYTYCTQTNTLSVIEDEEDSKNSTRNVRIIKAPFIRDLVVLEKRPADVSKLLSSASESNGAKQFGPASAFSRVEPTIGPVNLGSLAQKLDSATRAANIKISQKGVGVTQEAQDLFDALAKLLPTHWVGKSILVLDEVTIDPPYTSQSCRADTQSPALDRIKHVVDAERKRQEDIRHARSKFSEERKGG